MHASRRRLRSPRRGEANAAASKVTLKVRVTSSVMVAEPGSPNVLILWVVPVTVTTCDGASRAWAS